MAGLLIHQFDVFRNPGRVRDRLPYIMILQSDVIHQTRSVIVAPFISTTVVQQSRLTPVFDIEGRNFTLVTMDLASVPRSTLIEFVRNLDSERYRVISALDLLFTGA